MKLITVLSLGFLVCFPALGAVRRGELLCDLSSPKAGGFALVALRDLPNTYEGSHDVEDLRLKGSYFPSQQSFTLTLVRVNEDTGEDAEFLAESTQHLGGTDYLRLKLAVPATKEKAASLLEIFCRVHWN